jgi:hypothetical protein
MNSCYEPSRSRTLLLMSALVAGGVATQFVPAYQEVAFISPAKEAVSAPASPGASLRGMTGIDVNTHVLNLLRNIS